VITGGVIFAFDFSEWGAPTNVVEIGTILGKEAQVDTAHYNVGISIIAGDGCRMKVGSLLGLNMGIMAYGPTHEKHIGMWNIDVDTILGCDHGIYLRSGTTDGINAGIESNIINVNYMAYCKIAVSLESDQPNAVNITGNIITIRGLEMHHYPNYVGFYVSGEQTYSNTLRVNGNLIPYSTTAYALISIAREARENLFELCYMDWNQVTNTGGYNIFRQKSNQNSITPILGYTNDNGRSEIADDVAPTTNKWRIGDICWNTVPAAAGTLGWVCTTTGAPGVWKVFGSIAA